MLQNFQLHLLNSECYYNQNLTISNSPNLRGLEHLWRTAFVNLKKLGEKIEILTLTLKLHCYDILPPSISLQFAKEKNFL